MNGTHVLSCDRIYSMLFLMMLMIWCRAYGNVDSADPNLAEGRFLDSAVEGLSYRSGTQSGLTDANGIFVYESGQTVQFSVGDIVIGEAKAKPVMTPLDLVDGAASTSNPTVTNIARFLQTLDDDANSENGITITEPVRTQATGRSLDFGQSTKDFAADESVLATVSALTTLTTAGTRAIVTSQQAQEHLNRTLLVYRFSHTTPQGEVATGDIGIWMFKRNELSMDAIADWLWDLRGIGLDGTKLREPVNVLWVDFVSSTEQEAKDRICSFLEDSDFSTESAPFHSAGYSGYYSNSAGETEWRPQFGPLFGLESTLATWVDLIWPNANNHGRIFPAFGMTSSYGDPVFVTTGAFSHETECNDEDLYTLCLTGHNFKSFNMARDALKKSGGWRESAKLRVGNEYPPNPLLDFTTGTNTGADSHHDGVRVFALYDKCELFPPVGAILTYRIVGTSSTFSVFIEEVDELIAGYEVYRVRRSDSPAGLGEYYACDPEVGRIAIAVDSWDFFDPSDHLRRVYDSPIALPCGVYGSEVGDSCEWIGNLTDGAVSDRLSIEVLGYDTVTVPYGTFEAMIVRSTAYSDWGFTLWDDLEWIDDHNRILRSEDTETGDAIELINYEVIRN